MRAFAGWAFHSRICHCPCSFSVLHHQNSAKNAAKDPFSRKRSRILGAFCLSGATLDWKMHQHMKDRYNKNSRDEDFFILGGYAHGVILINRFWQPDLGCVIRSCCDRLMHMRIGANLRAAARHGLPGFPKSIRITGLFGRSRLEHGRDCMVHPLSPATQRKLYHGSLEDALVFAQACRVGTCSATSRTSKPFVWTLECMSCTVLHQCTSRRRM